MFYGLWIGTIISFKLKHFLGDTSHTVLDCLSVIHSNPSSGRHLQLSFVIFIHPLMVTYVCTRLMETHFHQQGHTPNDGDGSNTLKWWIIVSVSHASPFCRRRRPMGSSAEQNRSKFSSGGRDWLCVYRVDITGDYVVVICDQQWRPEWMPVVLAGETMKWS